MPTPSYSAFMLLSSAASRQSRSRPVPLTISRGVVLALSVGVVGCSTYMRYRATQVDTTEISPLTQAHWIAADTTPQRMSHDTQGSNFSYPVLRKTFTVSSISPITRAQFIATALGSYVVTLNGHSVMDNVLAPEWTDYRQRVQYQQYDVTSLVQPGTNALGVLLGEGWYGSRMGESDRSRYTYGPPPVRLLSLLVVTHADGHREIIPSDSTWHSAPGPVHMSQIYAGESYDARQVQRGWDRADFDDHAWIAAREYPSPADLLLVPQIAPPIRRTRMLSARRTIVVAPDTVVYDLGQNIAGWARIHVRGPRGAIVQLRFAEVLKRDGRHIDRTNLVFAAATDTYTLAGGGQEIFEPHFTYHGFRYIEVATSHGVRAESPTGIVIGTDAPETADVESSNPELNRLWSNIQWSLRANLMSVPTDCPQRSERLGWTGDAQVFWPTATYLMDLRSFTRKWLQDLRDTQAEIPAGCFPDFSPTVHPPGVLPDCGGPGWSDAGVLVPGAAYQQYGDTAMVRQHWAAMERYMAYIAAGNPSGLWVDHSLGNGDWLPAGDTAAEDRHTSQELIATAFWAADALAMRTMAHGIGDRVAEARYAALYDQVRTAFQHAYVQSDGVVGHAMLRPGMQRTTLLTSQTSYVLALRYGLVPDSLRLAAVRHLIDDIAAHGGHLATGFLGTPHLLPVLSEQGRDDVAYALLLTTTFPSWLYMVEHGATTMWERWNGDQELTSDMNSYNHYAYGSVGMWILRYAAGIMQDTGATGFTRVVIHPHLDPQRRLTHIRARYRSASGDIVSAWTLDPATGAITQYVHIPPHTTARIDVPMRREYTYIYTSHDVGPGTYRFSSR